MGNRMAKSLRELGRGVNRAHTVAARWVEHPAWNQARKPPWNIDRATAWARDNLNPNPAAAWDESDLPTERSTSAAAPIDGVEALRRNPLQAARLKLAVVRAQKIELERQILSAEFVPRADVEAALVRRVHAAKAGFQALPREMAAELASMTDENKIERLLQTAIDGVLLGLAEQIELPRPPKLENRK